MSTQFQTQSKVSNKSLDTPTANHAVKHHFSSQRGFSAEAQHYPIQTKLKIGQPGDKYEQEADRVADGVMRVTDPAVQLKPGWPFAEGPSCGDEDREGELIQTWPIAKGITPLVQRQAEDEEAPVEELEAEEWPIMTKGISSGTQRVNSDLPARLNRSKGSGQPLPDADRAFMERTFGVDFSDVKMHTDSNAVRLSRELNAEAFTHGRNIYFGTRRYNPGTPSGKRLMAHELTHVVQQSGGTPSRSVIQRRVQVNPNTGATDDILSQFRFLCPGSWRRTGQRIAGHATAVATQSSICLEDTVNDPSRTYTINVDTVSNTSRTETMHDGTVQTIPYPSSGPRTYNGTNPTIHMAPSTGSAIEFGAFESSGSAAWAPNWRILAHELCGHARLNQSYTGTKGDRPEHNSTIDTENAIAAEHGGAPRGHYNDPRQGESFHNPAGSRGRLVFKLVDGWHYEPTAPVPPLPVIGIIQGRITASALRIRQRPNISSPILGLYPRGTIINITCQTSGTNVLGNSLWDRTVKGYVSDRYVNRIRPSVIKLPTC